MGEWAVPALKGWHLLGELCCGTTWITGMVKDALTLHLVPP
ncbi:hypothetical protein [Streptomyces sp. NPDC059008]